jgi:cytochrome c2
MKIFFLPLFLFLISVLLSTAFAGDAAHGKKLFTQRSCNSCHSVGSEGSAQTGPNLAGVVQKRSGTWLKKFLKNPDKMEETDPVTKEMEAKYHAKMPNVGLTDAEISDLIAYLAAPATK